MRSTNPVGGLFLYCLWVELIDPKAVLSRRFVRRNINLLKSAVRPNTRAVWFDIQEIRDATDNFSDHNLIGQGGFARVYRGRLPDSRLIAVKRIRNYTAEGDFDFLNEVEIINNIRHRSLVILRGCCVASDEREGHQRLLIYDYMPNGSLDEHLFGGKSNARPLNWPQRRNIVMGAAKGLAYLHNGIKPAIYHRDIKSTDILLDEKMNACLADFGVARIMIKEGESHVMTNVAGTIGYMAPEYALYGSNYFSVLLLYHKGHRKKGRTSILVFIPFSKSIYRCHYSVCSRKSCWNSKPLCYRRSFRHYKLQDTKLKKEYIHPICYLLYFVFCHWHVYL